MEPNKPEDSESSVAPIGLRPTSLSDFAGQEQVKRVLNLILSASRKRVQAPAHLLFEGPAGCGKTTLAMIVAGECMLPMITIHAPNIEKVEEIQGIFAEIASKNEPCVVFIDEIHRLKKKLQEGLYPIMEDYKVIWMDSEIQLPRFTLVAATTEFGTLSAPMRDRFGQVFSITDYKVEDMERIIQRASGVLGMQITNGNGHDLGCPETYYPVGHCNGSCSLTHIEDHNDAVRYIAERSRMTPRNAIRLLERSRDVTDMHSNDGLCDIEIVTETMEILGIDSLGLNEQDRNYMSTLLSVHGGGAGLEAIALSTRIDETTIVDVIEPHLMRIGMIERNPKGRDLTTKAIQHLGVKIS